jgi:hypothetical protein
MKVPRMSGQRPGTRQAARRIVIDECPDWDEVTSIIRRSYVLVAPKRLAALLA